MRSCVYPCCVVIAGLKVGVRVDAKLPLTDRWAHGRIVAVAPAPFLHWYRVAFDGLGLEWWRWITWEGVPSHEPATFPMLSSDGR